MLVFIRGFQPFFGCGSFESDRKKMFLKGRKHHKNSFEIFHQETFVQLARQCQSCWSKFKTFVFRICPTSILQNRLSLLRSGINFINVLCTAFALVDPKSVKYTVVSSVSFYAFGSTSVKAVSRSLMKLSLGILWNEG